MVLVEMKGHNNEALLTPAKVHLEDTEKSLNIIIGT